ncbi:MAG: type II secretion system protein [Pseudomonadota bacterium]
MNRGFTLLEVLLAFVILGIVIPTIYGAYSSTFSIVNSTTGETEIYAMARVAMERIVEDLEGVYLPEGYNSTVANDSPYGFIATEGDVAGGGTPKMVFTSTSHLAFSGTAGRDMVARIAYSVKPGDEDAGFGICRSDEPNPSEALETGKSQGPVLCERLADAQIIFFNIKGDENKTWDSRSDTFEYKVPASVTIRLSFINPSNPDAPHVFLTSVTIPAGMKQ